MEALPDPLILHVSYLSLLSSTYDIMPRSKTGNAKVNIMFNEENTEMMHNIRSLRLTRKASSLRNLLKSANSTCAICDVFTFYSVLCCLLFFFSRYCLRLRRPEALDTLAPLPY